MSVAVIIERIEAALAAGGLAPVMDSSRFLPVETVGDLLKPWDEVYPGADADCRGYSSAAVRHPLFTPVPRRSRAPLPAPRPIAPSPGLADPGLFASFKAIWDWYEAKGKADEKMAFLPLNEKGLQEFIDPLEEELGRYWPLMSFLGELPYHFDLMGQEGVSLCLPHFTYEEEGVEAVEAFLSGHRGVASLMSSLGDYLVGTAAYELPDKDVALIKEVGWAILAETHENYDGTKSVDLDKTFRWYDTFFGEVRERFPEQADKIEFVMISGDGGHECEVWIESKEDIEFCIAYAEAFASLGEALPDPYDFIHNEGGEAETFAHEMCEVWRKVNKKRSVKWTSPKKTALARLAKEGRL